MYNSICIRCGKKTFDGTHCHNTEGFCNFNADEYEAYEIWFNPTFFPRKDAITEETVGNAKYKIGIATSEAGLYPYEWVGSWQFSQSEGSYEIYGRIRPIKHLDIRLKETDTLIAEHALTLRKLEKDRAAIIKDLEERLEHGIYTGNHLYAKVLPGYEDSYTKLTRYKSKILDGSYVKVVKSVNAVLAEVEDINGFTTVSMPKHFLEPINFTW